MSFAIRPYHPSDLPGLYRIALQTSNNGEDGTGLISDPDLVGHLVVGPYIMQEPELCYVLTHGEFPAGFIVGTSNSKAFYKWCRETWFPRLRGRYPPDSPNNQGLARWMVRIIHEGLDELEETKAYPAHLHINLLPIARRKGWGRKLIERLIQALREKDVGGLHLEAAIANPNAVAFYEQVGFERVQEWESSIIFGMRL